MCAECPVQAECLDEALARIPYGIAGGLTPEERRHIRAGRRRDAGNPVAQAAAAIEARLRPGASSKEVREAGRVLLAAGRPVHEVAARCGVAERTASRWATTASNELPAAVGGTGKGRGCSRPFP